MASEGDHHQVQDKPAEALGSKQEDIIIMSSVRKILIFKDDDEMIKIIVLVLRVIALLGTAAATTVMGLNKETKTLVVGAIGTTPITSTLHAKFHQTPAFVYVHSSPPLLFTTLILTGHHSYYFLNID